MKLKKKITAAFLGLALLGVVAGFCDGLVNTASASMMAPTSDIAIYKQAMPFSNSVKPCCVDRHDGQPINLASVFSPNVKLVPTNISAVNTDSIIYFENNFKEYSDTSPPKPDILSSVLRLE